MSLNEGYDIPENLRSLDEDGLLGGSMISPVFAFDGGEEEYEHIFEWDQFTDAVWQKGPYEVVGCIDFEPECMAARIGGKVVGFYLDGQAWVEPAHRGNGLGTAMVLSFMALHGKPPSTRGIGFSEEGYAIHLKALEALASLHDDASRPAAGR